MAGVAGVAGVAGEAGEAGVAGEGTITALARRLAERTAGFTGADLLGLCQRAALVALQQRGPVQATQLVPLPPQLVLRAADFDEALCHVAPSVTPSMIARLERWSEARGGSSVTGGAGGGENRS